MAKMYGTACVVGVGGGRSKQEVREEVRGDT